MTINDNGDIESIVGTVKLKPIELKSYAWPDCAKRCSAIEYFGASECDFICGWRDFNIKKGGD